MNFNSLQFLIFLLLTLVAFWSARPKYRVHVLLIASYVYYCYWDWRFSFLLIYITISNFYFGSKIQTEETLGKRKLHVGFCLTNNLIILGLFKYFDFFLSGATKITKVLGLSYVDSSLRIIIPLGLSFYIFQTSSYVIDVYRGNLRAEKSLFRFATFVSYFPHMAAGPIMPARILLPQMARIDYSLNQAKLQSAMLLIANGMFRKIVIADSLAPMVSRIFENRAYWSGYQSLTVATIGFGIQIYGDFSGYSMMARGISRLFDIEMMVNFKQPYFATSITDFWRRWHISLSTWFRDYLYVPLGGNRRGFARTLLNLFAVMVIAGLWHGAAIGFVLWGALHGFYLVIDKVRTNFVPKWNHLHAITSLLGWILTMIAVFVAWILFRNPNFEDFWSILRSIATFQKGAYLIPDVLLVGVSLASICLLDFAEVKFSSRVKESSPIMKGLIFGFLVLISLVYRSSTIVPFIYFRF